MGENSPLLYIGEKIIKVRSGGDAVNLRNYTALNQISGGNLHHYELKHKNRITTFYNLLKGNVGVICSKDYNSIYRYIRRHNIESAFLWSSKLGKLARDLKTKFPNIQIITFFHNIEKQYYEEETKINPSLKNRFISTIVIKNEALAVEYSDYLITLNSRDSRLLENFYGRKSDFELPISFEDTFDADKAERCRRPNGSKSLKLLFVGSNFFANNTGLEWFIKNVMPYLSDVELTIVGKGMDEVFQNSDKVTVKGYVEDLSEYYYSSDAVIAPIFHGGGMKTKTAEALMYGCPIIGTKEAFEGYDIEYSKVGGLAQTPQEIIDVINRLKDTTFAAYCREYARKEFLCKYSIDYSVKTLRKYLL